MRTINQSFRWVLSLSLVLWIHLDSHAAPAPDIEHGKALAATCLACHGTENFKADPLYSVPRLGQQNARYLFNALKAYKSGQRSNLIMQAQVTALSDQDLRDLAEYFGRRESADPASVAAVRALGEGGDTTGVPVKVVEVCGSCHGETGGGSMPETPSLAGQYSDYMVYALDEYRSGKRKSAFMQPLAKLLTKAEIKEIADYYAAHASQPFSVKTIPFPIGKRPDVSSAANPAAPKSPQRSGLEVVRDIAMIDIPAGSFMMGDAASEGFTVGSPKHEVKIKAFRIGKYEITFEQYDAFAQETKRALPDDEGWGRGNRPVINVTWADTQAFIAWLNKKTGKKYRLPSEAEWEYAARGGTTTVYWWGDTFNAENMNANGTNQRDQWIFTAPVGEFSANPYGLYDTSGNVAERVTDCWHHTYKGAPVDGSAWLSKTCQTRISRGGSWNLAKRPMRSSARAGIADDIASTAVGFRLVQDIK